MITPKNPLKVLKVNIALPKDAPLDAGAALAHSYIGAVFTGLPVRASQSADFDDKKDAFAESEDAVLFDVEYSDCYDKNVAGVHVKTCVLVFGYIRLNGQPVSISPDTYGLIPTAMDWRVGFPPYELGKSKKLSFKDILSINLSY